jgi:hypothetical protein
MRSIVGAMALFAIAGVAVPAAAHDIPSRPAPAAQVSVFPTPRDPWRSWGDAQNDGRHRGPLAESRVAPSTVWIPGQWVWNGAAWLWWPGHWAQR